MFHSTYARAEGPLSDGRSPWARGPSAPWPWPWEGRQASPWAWPWPWRASPWALPLCQAGARADGRRRRRRGRPARIIHSLEHIPIECVDGQHEPVRGQHGVARAEDAALFGGLAVGCVVHCVDNPRALLADSKPIDAFIL